MPYQDYMKIISVDDHLIEHERVWLDRLPSKYHDRAPHVISDGYREFWVYDDLVVPYANGLGTAAGRDKSEWSMEGMRRDNILPGCYDPVERLKDMDIDGVWAQLSFPTFPRFAGTRFLAGRDKALALLCVQAYNDFVVDEWCATNPQRYIPLGILPLWDPELAAKEVERVAAKGMKSVTFPEMLEPLGLPSFHTGKWDPVFAAVSECSLPLSSHVGTSGGGSLPISSDATGMAEQGTAAAQIGLLNLPLMGLVADMIFSQVFIKFPDLKLVLSEGGVGWIPWLKERLDQVWDKQSGWSGVNANARPSEVFDQHFSGCFIDDLVGIREREAIGVNNMMIEVDYPHSDSTWPDTRKRVIEVLADVPDEEAHKIVELNAREIYHFPG